MDKHGNATWAISEASLGILPPVLNSELLGLRRLPVRQGQLHLLRARPHRRLPRAPPTLAQRTGSTRPPTASSCSSATLRTATSLAGSTANWRPLQARPEPDLEAARQEALIGPLRNIYGVSDKVLTMALSSLLIGARGRRPIWFETGKAMIAIDTLVHNFLHRTGILHDCGVASHLWRRLLRPGGCAEIIRAISSRIDARTFNPKFPAQFPRFVQHAIWRFCAADGLNLCNGNRIDDRKACQITYCYLYQKCRPKTAKNAIKSMFYLIYFDIYRLRQIYILAYTVLQGRITTLYFLTTWRYFHDYLETT